MPNPRPFLCWWLSAVIGLAPMARTDRMNQDLTWTQKPRDALLGQQAERLDTLQALGKGAPWAGNLQSTEDQTVEVQTQESRQIIVMAGEPPSRAGPLLAAADPEVKAQLKPTPFHG